MIVINDRTILTEDIEPFAKHLLEWARENSRSYPWRTTKDPYELLIAELMLRRTRADQVERVYRKFLKRFPDQEALISAQPKELRKILKPLGLTWRIENFVALRHYLQGKQLASVPRSV